MKYGSWLGVQTAEYGKCTPEIFSLKHHCTPNDGCGTLKLGVALLFEAFILPQ